MTYPASGSSNAWGPYFSDGSTPVNTDPAQPPAAAPVAPQSPSGSFTGQSATFNFNESETSTEEFLTDVLEVQSPQSGLPAQTSAPTLAGVPSSQIAWNNWTAGTGTTGTKFS
jgi:hypothetical protein